ncbi:hypothetical protein M422DRAFT_250199 [Sphaerobolus stellatus SS14]|uniref:Unplaced genomic scaffold SPHSTscaffold_33, whole genome shotgun sequence n=1 Tax=Sphaerobolus stellatus (strain SS14) TaxID=990650 RepID=A0A0C9UTI6_SPHS4|nr:hypothetical protein M422DRAFT_250199 [Sphaerobolus stellatus SS14]
MPSEQPPPYDEIMEQLKELQENMTPEMKDEAYKAMAEKAASSKDEIIKEVQMLAERAIATDRVFESIRRKLAIVDENNYEDKYGQPIPKLEPTWIKYQNRYIDLLWQSRSAATKTEAYIRDFTQIIIPILLEPDSEYEDNLTDLNAFINRRNPVSPDTQDDDFDKLRADVAAFTASFVTWADDVGAQLTEEITSLMDATESLKTELAQCNNLITEMAIAIGLTVVGTAVGIIVALACLAAAPATIVEILIAGIGAIIGEMATLISAMIRRAEIEEEIAEKERQIDELNKQLEILGELKSMLQRCTEEASEIFHRLGSFSHIWAMVAQDATYIRDHPKLPEIHTNKGIQAQIKLMESVYAPLADSLAYYATLIDQSSIPRSTKAYRF